VRAVLHAWIVPVFLLVVQHQVFLAQEVPIKNAKKNPSARHVEMKAPEKDTNKVSEKKEQRPLPKFDLPEFIITGTASIDLPNLEKIMTDDSADVPRRTVKSSEKKIRDRETLALEMKSRYGTMQGEAGKYSGFATAGMGTYFTPQAELQFGQSIPDYFYSLGGKYFLTQGYAPNTDRSSGGFTASGGTTLTSSSLQILQDAALNGNLGYRSETFHFYGSASPNLQRTFSDFQLSAGLENQTLIYLPYSAGISLQSLDISDSSASANETRLDLNCQTSFPIASLPVQTKFHFMSASGGLAFMDLSAGVQNYRSGGILFDVSLHWYWAKGMAGQDMARLCPNFLAGYQISTQHRIYLSYEPMFVPMTLASNLTVNRFLSAASTIIHEYIRDAGELGIESHWTEALSSRVFLNVKSVHDVPMFSDSSRHGVWLLAYGGMETIATFCAEMVAKLNSNDYFASNILLRSMNDSFTGGKIPYTPAIEIWCSAIHKLGTTMAVSADARFTGERTTDIAGTVSLSKYAVVDLRCEYSPAGYVKVSAGIKNLTDTHFEIWRGYKEFPLTMQLDAQIKW
jgi:hypothetical protein